MSADGQRPGRRILAAAAGVVVVVVAVAVTAILRSSGHQPQASAAHRPLTGDQLAAALLPLDDLPPGYAPQPRSDVTSGGTILPAGSAITVSGAACGQALAIPVFTEWGQFEDPTNFGATAFAATSAITTRPVTGFESDLLINQAVYQFGTGARAADLFSAIRTCMTTQAEHPSMSLGSSGSGSELELTASYPTQFAGGIGVRAFLLLHGSDIFAISLAQTPYNSPLSFPQASELLSRLITRAATAGTSPARR